MSKTKIRIPFNTWPSLALGRGAIVALPSISTCTVMSRSPPNAWVFPFPQYVFIQVKGLKSLWKIAGIITINTCHATLASFLMGQSLSLRQVCKLPRSGLSPELGTEARALSLLIIHPYFFCLNKLGIPLLTVHYLACGNIVFY